MKNEALENHGASSGDVSRKPMINRCLEQITSVARKLVGGITLSLVLIFGIQAVAQQGATLTLGISYGSTTPLPTTTGPVFVTSSLDSQPYNKGAVSIEGLPPNKAPLRIQETQQDWPKVKVNLRDIPGASTLPLDSIVMNGVLDQGFAQRWYWNDEFIPDIAAWLRDGSSGKWGTYRVVVWDVRNLSEEKQRLVITNSEPPKFTFGRAKPQPDETYRNIGEAQFTVEMESQAPKPVWTGLNILQQPPEAIAARAGETFQLSTKAEGTSAFTYQWEVARIPLFSSRYAKVSKEQYYKQDASDPYPSQMWIPLSSGPTIQQQLKAEDFLWGERDKYFRELEHLGWIPKDEPCQLLYRCRVRLPLPQSLIYGSVWLRQTFVCSRTVEVSLVKAPICLNASRIWNMGDVGSSVELSPVWHSAESLKFVWDGPACHDSTGRVTVTEKGRLNINSAKLEDGGTYRCKATNASGSTTVELDLTVVAPPGNVPSRAEQEVQAIWSGRKPKIIWSGAKLVDENKRRNVIASDEQGLLRFKSAPYPGQVICTYEAEWLPNPPDRIPNKKVIVTSAQVIAIEQKAEQPAFTLPDGRIGQPYSFEPPLPSLSASGNRFSITGLPKGLKASANNGKISGWPEVAGKFVVKFIVSNSKGAAPVINLPLQISPLPEGIAGTYLLWGSDFRRKNGDRTFGGIRMNVTVTNSGLISGQVKQNFPEFENKPSFVTRVVIDSDGKYGFKTDFGDYTFGPESGYVSGSLKVKVASDYATSLGQMTGWIDRWEKDPMPVALSGRYNFSLRLKGLPSDLMYGDQGDAHGSLSVSAKGKSTSAYYSSVDSTPFLTSAFLGPKGEALIFCSTEWYPTVYDHDNGLWGKLSTDGKRLESGDFAASIALMQKRAKPTGEEVFISAGWSVGNSDLRDKVFFEIEGSKYEEVRMTSRWKALAGRAGQNELTLHAGIPAFGSVSEDIFPLSKAGIPGIKKPAAPWVEKFSFNPSTGEYSGRLRLSLLEMSGRINDLFIHPIPFHGVVVLNEDDSFTSFGSFICRDARRVTGEKFWLSEDEAESIFSWPWNSVPVHLNESTPPATTTP